MDLKAFVIVFGTVFLAELGDKTQLATVLFASRENINLFGVFVAASLALNSCRQGAVWRPSFGRNVWPRGHRVGWGAAVGPSDFGRWLPAVEIVLAASLPYSTRCGKERLR